MRDETGEKIRVGTKRYMAPEVLENSLDDLLFFNFCRADMYSISLVFWEIIQRVETENIPAKTYALPYEHMVPSDPSIEDMKNVVVDSALRPDFDKMLGLCTIKIEKKQGGCDVVAHERHESHVSQQGYCYQNGAFSQISLLSIDLNCI